MASKPNLLFISTDQQRYDTLACYGNAAIQMPNLNRLAASSYVFEQAYCTQPICTPSRSSIMTGIYPHANGCTRNNALLSLDTAVLVEMLSDGEYVTGYHGKWHLGDEVFCQHGFDEWVSIEDNYAPHARPWRDKTTKSSYHDFLIANGCVPAKGPLFTREEQARLSEELSKPAYLAGTASRFIREHRDSPFALYVNLLEPHAPYFGPRDGQYDPADVVLPGNLYDRPTEKQPLKARMMARGYYEHGKSGLQLRDEAGWRRLIANYWGLCSLVDTHVGTILDTLDQCGLRDDTIVVFTSDHGDMMGSHRLLTKFVMFEESTRVPLLVRLPGQYRSYRIEGPMSQIDLVPTLLDLMGQTIPANPQGNSLAPYLLQRRDLVLARDVVIEWLGADQDFRADLAREPLPGWMAELGTREDLAAAVSDPVRTLVTPEGWKLNYSPLGEHELYDLGADPLERTNLAAAKQHSPLMRDLADRIRAWQARTGDTGLLEL